MADLAYSYHNFIFPFIWQHNDDENITFKTVKTIFSNRQEVWGDSDLAYYDKINLEQNSTSTDVFTNRLKYATYQYFQPAIREAVFGVKKNNVGNKAIKKGRNIKEVVQNFYFKPVKSSENAYYIISKSGVTYQLDLNDVKLKLYNTGVGLLCFACENSKYQGFSDIKSINEYGRRITLPYIPENKSISSCADSISVKWENIELEEKFSAHIDAFNSFEEEAEFNHVADFIVEILNYHRDDSSEISLWFTTNESESKKNRNRLFVEPALDDRMFVMCGVNDRIDNLLYDKKEEYDIEFTAQNGNEESAVQRYLTDLYKDDYAKYEDIEKSLYEFIFCDPPNGCTCQSPVMRRQLIREHLYSRWADWGTIYTVAAQSFMFICAGTENHVEHLFDYYRTEYYELVCLTLVQRASLRVFQSEASLLSAHIEDPGWVPNKEKRARIADLQEKLIAFQNQINLYEVSSQEQAIELYDMMRNVFLVNKYTSILQEQLDGLYNIANIRQSDAFSRLAGTIAVIALIIALPSFINDFAFVPQEWFDDGLLNKNESNYSGIILFVKFMLGLWICKKIKEMFNK